MSNLAAEVDLQTAEQQQAPASGTVEEDTPWWYCITKVPICGGFCAKTKSTEQSCLRHFSNEATPPQPCLGRYCCRRFWEHNWLCTLHGRLGACCGFGAKYRHYIMLSAFCVSFIAWICQLAAIAALSTHQTPVQNVYWAKSFVVFNATMAPPYGKDVTSYMGINRRVDVTKTYSHALRQDYTETTEVKDWTTTSTCTISGFSEPLPGCETCGDTAKGTAMLLISSAVTQVFQMTTDLQRSTLWGDLHCQKSLGTITGLYGFYSTLQSISTFMSDCTLSSFGGWFNTHTEEAPDAGLPVEFSSGPGLVLLSTATVFKLYDVLCHMIVPVAAKQNEYVAEKGCCEGDDEGEESLAAYMGRNDKLTNWNELIDHNDNIANQA